MQNYISNILSNLHISVNILTDQQFSKRIVLKCKAMQFPNNILLHAQHL